MFFHRFSGFNLWVDNLLKQAYYLFDVYFDGFLSPVGSQFPAGIDGALHLVARLKGEAEALRIARHMEYDKYVPEQGLVVKH